MRSRLIEFCFCIPHLVATHLIHLMNVNCPGMIEVLLWEETVYLGIIKNACMQNYNKICSDEV